VDVLGPRTDFDTIKPYTLEEAYEVLEAIDNRDWPELTGELGDLLLQVLFYPRWRARRDIFRWMTCSTGSPINWWIGIRMFGDAKRIPPRKFCATGGAEGAGERKETAGRGQGEG